MAEINAWVTQNPMWIHIPIGLALAFFILWWLWLVYRLGYGFAVLKLRRRRFLYIAVMGLAAAWGLYASSLFESAPIYWM